MKLDDSPYDADGNLKNGPYQEFFENGILSCEGQHKDGDKVGEWKYYQRDGLLKASGEYRDGQMFGEWKFYSKYGYVKSTLFE